MIELKNVPDNQCEISAFNPQRLTELHIKNKLITHKEQANKKISKEIEDGKTKN